MRVTIFTGIWNQPSTLFVVDLVFCHLLTFRQFWFIHQPTVSIPYFSHPFLYQVTRLPYKQRYNEIFKDSVHLDQHSNAWLTLQSQAVVDDDDDDAGASRELGGYIYPMMALFWHAEPSSGNCDSLPHTSVTFTAQPLQHFIPVKIRPPDHNVKDSQCICSVAYSLCI